MATWLKIAAVALFVALGTYLTFQSGIDHRAQSMSNCVAARALFCVLR
jgi:L-asparagine transporter-like permease